MNPAAVKAEGSTVAAPPPVSSALVRLSPVLLGEMSSKVELTRLVKGDGDTSDAWLESAGALLQPSDQLAGGEREGGYGHKLDALALSMGSSSSSSRKRLHKNRSDEEEGDVERLLLLRVKASWLPLLLLVLAVLVAPTTCGVCLDCPVIHAPVCSCCGGEAWG